MMRVRPNQRTNRRRKRSCLLVDSASSSGARWLVLDERRLLHVCSALRVLQKAVSTTTNTWLAQWIEHQTLHLAVTGSTPVPNAAKNRSGAKAPPNARGGGRFVGLPLALCSRGVKASQRVTCRRQHKTVPCSVQIPLVRFLGNDKPTSMAMREPCSSSALGRAKSTPWIAQAQAHSAYGCGTDVSLRPQGYFMPGCLIRSPGTHSTRVCHREPADLAVACRPKPWCSRGAIHSRRCSTCAAQLTRRRSKQIQR